MGDEQQELRQLKEYLVSSVPEWDKMKMAAQRLSEIDGEAAFNYFIGLLDLNNEQNWSRNIAALMLRDIGDNRAVDPLFTAILKKENINYNSTLVYALERLDCSRKFRELFEVLFYHGEAAQMSAHSILAEQDFLFDNNDLEGIKAEWESIKANSKGRPKNEQVLEWMKGAVDQYMVYLK